jgi:hypothetical protein
MAFSVTTNTEMARRPSISRAGFAVAAALASSAGATAFAQDADSSPAASGITVVATGMYECWASGTTRTDLRFTVTGEEAYEAADGSMGAFLFDPATGEIAFTGYVAAAIPAGVVAIYQEPAGRPTISFRNDRGAELLFCERF